MQRLFADNTIQLHMVSMAVHDLELRFDQKKKQKNPLCDATNRPACLTLTC